MSMAASPVKAILDTSVYLPFLRRGGEIDDLTFLRRPTLLYLSNVVFAELYAAPGTARPFVCWIIFTAPLTVPIE